MDLWSICRTSANYYSAYISAVCQSVYQPKMSADTTYTYSRHDLIARIKPS